MRNLFFQQKLLFGCVLLVFRGEGRLNNESWLLFFVFFLGVGGGVGGKKAKER